MFESHFNLKQNPFKLDLDLSYLFWGKHQEEVIAHLRYAISEGEGFIAITGERGIGKTILCHSFIENLPENTFSAYINNPVGRSEELLRDINRQFGIEYEAETVQELTDALNTFLMQTKLEGNKAAVFIDDAHVLNNETLEQVRLISNLETSKFKLIQIVLLGTPRLTEMLSSYALRQIGQRVSVKYRIAPFDYTETISYIGHRLSIAAEGLSVQFDRSAYRHIYKFSGGYPRAINIACGQALMKAFHMKAARITGDIAKEALKNLNGPGERALRGYIKHSRVSWLAFGCSVLAAVAAGVYLLQPQQFDAIEKPAPAGIMEEWKAAVPRSTETQSTPPPIKMASAPAKRLEDRDRSELTVSPLESNREGFQTKPSPPPEMTHSVQVGAFLKMENAKRLVGQLKVKGYISDIVSVYDSNSRLWYTVRTGDYPSEKAARVAADQFSALEKMETAVRPFNRL